MRRMLRRPWKGRLLCGVRMGLAARLGMPVMLVRLAFVGLCLAHGLGIFACDGGASDSGGDPVLERGGRILRRILLTLF